MERYSDDTLRAIVRHYRQWRKTHPDTWLDYCVEQDTFASVVEAAVLAENRDRKMHPHQYRIGRQRLRVWADSLKPHTAELKRLTDFDGLLSHLMQHRIPGISHVTVYDTAHRIGVASRNPALLPQKVYLHAGTRQGAEELLGAQASGRDFVLLEELPKPLHQLDPSDAEDLLCIYKGKWHQYPPDADSGCEKTPSKPSGSCRT